MLSKIIIVVVSLYLAFKIFKGYEPYDEKRWCSRRDWYRKSYLKSRHWRKVRRKALAKARYRCTNCGSRVNLTVHHLTYERIGHEKLSDLVCLCWDCHKKIHRNT